MMSKDVHSRGSLRAGRPGFVFGVLMLHLLPVFGCERDGAAPRDIVRLESGDVELPQGSRRHDIRLQGAGGNEEMTPAVAEARVGDAVAFEAADGMTHSVVFLADRLDSAQIAFLESTGQMRGPPLLAEGSTWIVTLAGAPSGDYPFACALHGGRGTVRAAPGE